MQTAAVEAVAEAQSQDSIGAQLVDRRRLRHQVYEVLADVAAILTVVLAEGQPAHEERRELPTVQFMPKRHFGRS